MIEPGNRCYENGIVGTLSLSYSQLPLLLIVLALR